MEIKQIFIKNIKTSKYNPRRITKEELEKLKKGIQEFGLVDPLIINADNTLIGGHQRLKAIKSLQWKEAPCVVLDLPKHKEKALNIALNKIGGEWEEEALQTILKELQEEVNFDIELTGFKEKDINLFMNSEVLEEKEEEIKYFQKTHILLSFSPDKFIDIQPLIEKIIAIEGVEYEQGSN